MAFDLYSNLVNGLNRICSAIASGKYEIHKGTIVLKASKPHTLDTEQWAYFDWMREQLIFALHLYNYDWWMPKCALQFATPAMATIMKRRKKYSITLYLWIALGVLLIVFLLLILLLPLLVLLVLLFAANRPPTQLRNNGIINRHSIFNCEHISLVKYYHYIHIHNHNNMNYDLVNHTHGSHVVR